MTPQALDMCSRPIAISKGGSSGYCPTNARVFNKLHQRNRQIGRPERGAGNPALIFMMVEHPVCAEA